MFGRIANILGWAGVALVLAGVATWLVRDDLVTLRQGFALAGLVCILVYAASQWREMAGTFSKRPARYAALAAVSVVVVLALLVGLNYLAEKYNKRWDLTAARDFTLSDQTRRLVGSLKEPLRLIVFAVAEDMQPYRDRLGEYQYLSNKVQIEYVDPNREPARARQYEIVAAGSTLIVEYQKRIERVSNSTNEQDITNAIVKAVQGLQRKIYFVTGHGEKDPTSNDEINGYAGANAAMQRDNYIVEKVALIQGADVPADAAALVVAGPTRDFLPPEIDTLRRYLNKGGKVLFLLDPPLKIDDPPLTSLVALAAEWGIEVGNDIVVDQSSRGQAVNRGPVSPVSAAYPSHPITERFAFATMFPLARSVTPSTGGGRNAQPLIETGRLSWAETDIKGLLETGTATADAAERRGPMILGAAVNLTAPDAPAPPPPQPGQKPAEPPKRPETRVVVIGDSDFAANSTISFSGNIDLFLNAVNWIAEQENLIAIRPKSPDDRRVTMTQDQLRLVGWLSLIIVPGAVFGLGVYNWWRRRG